MEGPEANLELIGVGEGKLTIAAARITLRRGIMHGVLTPGQATVGSFWAQTALHHP